eukprot:Gb_08773 [translate_table: standard]
MKSATGNRFRELYLKRFLGALGRVKRISAGGGLRLAKRRRAIKLAADISLAFTANRAAWSHALLNNISGIQKNKSLLYKIVGHKRLMRRLTVGRARHNSSLLFKPGPGLWACRKRYVRKRCALAEKPPANKRTEKLRSLIPGGRSMDTSSLLRETADYIAHLKTQVECSIGWHTNLKSQRKRVPRRIPYDLLL